MPVNRSMPAAPVIPVLIYRDVHEAAQWLCRAFGFRERLRIFDHRIQLEYEGGALVVADGSATPGGHSIMIRVADSDAHYAHAKSEGARIVNEPQTFPFGERQYTATDPFGHVWTFSQSVADVDPKDWGGVLVG